MSEGRSSINSSDDGNPIEILDVRLNNKETLQRDALDGIKVHDTDVFFDKMR